VTDLLDGDGIFADQNSGQRYKYVACPAHQKDYEIPVDRQGDYVMVIATILDNIKSGKWNEIIDRQRK